MRTTKKGKIDLKSKPQHYSNFYFSDAIRSHERNEDQLFVVPWQMDVDRKKEVVEE